MLNKLLKYDLKYVYKTLIVFYILDFVFALLTRGIRLFENSSLMQFVAFIMNIVTIVSFIATIIINIMKLWSRFVNNIYKDESYLTHTLPVTEKDIYISKFLSSILTITTSVIAIILSLFIIYYSQDFIELLKTSLDGLANAYDSTVISIIIVLFVVFLLELISVVVEGYTGILLGHRSGDHKMIKSIVIGFLFFMGTSILIIAVILLAGLFVKDIMDLFVTLAPPNVKTIKNLLLVAIVIYSLAITFYFIFDTHILKKGVNVD